MRLTPSKHQVLKTAANMYRTDPTVGLHAYVSKRPSCHDGIGDVNFAVSYGRSVSKVCNDATGMMPRESSLIKSLKSIQLQHLPFVRYTAGLVYYVIAQTRGLFS